MELSPWEAPTGQLLKNFLIFYGTRGFIAVFARARHWSLSEPDVSSPRHTVLLLLYFVCAVYFFIRAHSVIGPWAVELARK
jgi:hypothetical protein